MKYCIDANVFITAWHMTYPHHMFPTLYRKMEPVVRDRTVIIKPIFDEIENFSIPEGKNPEKEKPVRTWLTDKVGIEAAAVNAQVEQLSLELQREYEIGPATKGASKQDITLIAYACLNEHTVVSLESEQHQKPQRPSKYKIPLICKEQNVECITFVDFLDECGIQV